MSESYTYFLISYANVPATPTYLVWYSVWHKGESPCLTWTDVRPAAPAEDVPTWVIGCVENATAPANSVIAWSGAKCIPPPAMDIATTATPGELQAMLSEMMSVRGAIETYTYFMIPLASVPPRPLYTVWYAQWNPAAETPELTWSTTRPPLTPDTASTWVVGRIDDVAAPREATIVWNAGAKCIPPPSMRLTSGTQLSEFQTKFGLLLRSLRAA
jgi:hypothetical protein